MKRRDFTQRRVFPGTVGNRFDVILHRFCQVENIPAWLFAVLLFLLSWLPTYPAWTETIVIWLFMLTDWALISALPRAKRSFGPAKPPTFLLALMRLPFAFFPVEISAAIQILGTFLVVYGFWIEPHRIILSREKIETDKLKPGTRLRLLHIGDLHIERITARERQLNVLIRSTQPDLILFSGDFLNLSYLHDPQAWRALCEVVSQWNAPLGAFAVLGSPAVDLPEVINPLFKDLPVQILDQHRLTISHQDQEFDLIGLSCSHKPFLDAQRLLPLLNEDHDRYTILLYHSPDLSLEIPEGKIHLHLAGHTHGGQVRLPILGALFTGSLYGKQFEAGRYQIGSMVLYITRGVGLEGASAPRVRFLTPPEVIIWEIAGV